MAEQAERSLREAIEMADRLLEYWKKELEESDAWLRRSGEIPGRDSERYETMDRLSAEYAEEQIGIIQDEIEKMRASYNHLKASGFFAPFAFDDAMTVARERGVLIENEGGMLH